jgi:hypothetical protein
MANNNDNGGAVIEAIIVAVVVVTAVVMAVMALVSAGAVYGAGTALVNYGRALKESIQPERAAP